MTRFVLVPGMNHGGWWYDPLVERLTALGHTARAVTPTGLEEEPRLGGQITLQSHVQDTVAALDDVVGDEKGADDVVLVGHSYAGLLITGAADARPEPVRALVYLDAFVPHDGDSSWALTSQEERDWYVKGSRERGYAVDPLPFFDDRARPHPIATLLQGLPLTGAWRRVPTKVYAEALGWDGPSPLATSTARAKADAEFTTHSWNTRHNVMHDGPDRVLELIADL